MADTAGPFRPMLQEALYWGFQFNNRWISEGEWQRIRKLKFASTGELKRYMRGLRDGPKQGTPPVPRWVTRKLSKELGANVAYLAIPEVALLLFQGSALGWEPDKLQSAIQNTRWWRKRTEQQRAWDVAPDAEKNASLSRTSAWVAEQLIAVYGHDYVKKQSWSIESGDVQQWARRIASGKVDQSVWLYHRRRHAEQIAGTPAQTDLFEDRRRAGQAEMQIENTRGQLETLWKQWMGDHLPPPDFTHWASDIYANTRSMDDFNKFLEQQSASFYPTKPGNVPYATWVDPAKALLQRTLELGSVRDDDPLLQSYMLGQLPSLADLAERARRDPRYRQTEQAREHSRNIGAGILSAWGF